MTRYLLRATPYVVWLAFAMSLLALLFAGEALALRIYDAIHPPVTMTWQPETLPDGQPAVRFSGSKHRSECYLIEVLAWARIKGIEHRLGIERVGGAPLRHHEVGPFGPSMPWALRPAPTSEPRIEAEFRCSDRTVIVRIARATR